MKQNFRTFKLKIVPRGRRYLASHQWPIIASFPTVQRPVITVSTIFTKNQCRSQRHLSGHPSFNIYIPPDTTLLCRLLFILRSTVGLRIIIIFRNTVVGSPFAPFHALPIQLTDNLGCLQSEKYHLIRTSLTTSVHMLER